MKRECSYSETFPLLLIIKFSALIFFSSIFYSFILLLCSASLPSSHSLFFIMYFFVRRNEEVRGGEVWTYYISLRRFAPSVDGLLAALALEGWLAPTSSWLNPCFIKDLDLKIVIIYVKAVTWLKQKLLG